MSDIDDSIRIGRAFRAVRTAHGFSLLEVSKAVGLKSVSGWSRVETGESAMTVKQLLTACKCIGRDPCDIIKLASQL